MMFSLIFSFFVLNIADTCIIPELTGFFLFYRSYLCLQGEYQSCNFCVCVCGGGGGGSFVVSLSLKRHVVQLFISLATCAVSPDSYIVLVFRLPTLTAVPAFRIEINHASSFWFLLHSIILPFEEAYAGPEYLIYFPDCLKLFFSTEGLYT